MLTVSLCCIISVYSPVYRFFRSCAKGKTDVTPAILSRDKIASVTWRVAQLLNSRATHFPITAAVYSVQLRRENAVNADWSILVYATKLQCATRYGDVVAR